MRRTWSTLSGLLLIAALLVLVPRAGLSATLSSRVAVELATAVPAASQPRPLVVVRALGPMPQDRLRSACRSLLRTYPVRCEIGARRELVGVWSGWNVERAQLDARAALDVLFRDREEHALVELNLTGVDIFEEKKPYVFGLASLTDRIALVSLSRIDGDGSKRLARRLHKLVLHEVGHTLGLHHHDDPSCVMRQDPTTAALDSAPEGPCEVCHGRLESAAARLVRPGQSMLDRARGLLVRGSFDDARLVLAETLHSGEFDVDLLRGFATAFFEARQYNESISVLRFVVKRHPESAEAHVDLGLCYHRRNRDGDRELAIEHLETALELRPDWEQVGDLLEQLL